MTAHANSRAPCGHARVRSRRDSWLLPGVMGGTFERVPALESAHGAGVVRSCPQFRGAVHGRRVAGCLAGLPLKCDGPDSHEPGRSVSAMERFSPLERLNRAQVAR
jgi:hypothetical protein